MHPQPITLRHDRSSSGGCGVEKDQHAPTASITMRQIARENCASEKVLRR